MQWCSGLAQRSQVCQSCGFLQLFHAFSMADNIGSEDFSCLEHAWIPVRRSLAAPDAKDLIPDAQKEGRLLSISIQLSKATETLR